MSFDTTGLVAYVNGEYKPLSDASVSIFDHGFLYGDGVFEGMRVFDGGLFRAELHMERIARSARSLGLALPVETDEIVNIIGEVVRRSELQDAHVRPIITRGFGGPGIDPRLCPVPSLIVSAYPFPAFLGSDPIKLFTSAIVRNARRAREVAQLPRRDRRQAAGGRARRARRGDAGLARRRRRMHGREPLHHR